MSLGKSLLFSTSFIALAGMAQAQEQEPFFLGTLVLSGELQPRTVFETPTGVSVETGAQLEARGDASLYDFIERAPNVSASLGGNKGFTIRGIEQNGFGDAGQAKLISTQVDGVAIPGDRATFFGPYSSWDVQQVEVLRGPQSTQQGRNALAGAVVIETNDPSYENEFRLRTELGSRDSRAAAFVLNRVLVDDTLALRIAGETRRSDGLIDNPTLGTDEFDARSYDSIRAKLRWDPNPDLNVVLSYSYSENFGGEDFVLADRFPSDLVNTSNIAGEEGADHHIAGLELRYQINDWLSFESETSYYDGDYIRIEDTDALPIDYAAVVSSGSAESFEQDFRLRFEGDSVEGVVGLFYSKSEFARPAEFRSDGLFETLGIDLDDPRDPSGFDIINRIDEATESENFALYGEADIRADRWLPGLFFTVGARYDRDTIRQINRVQSVLRTPAGDENPIPILPNVNQDTEFTFDAFLPKLGVTYEFDADSRLSFTVQRAYRAGGAQVNEIQNRLNEFDPEFATNYELSYRTALLQDRLQLKANLFYSDWTDQQVAVQGPTTALNDFDVLNAGDSELWGAELALQYQHNDQLDLFFNTGFVRTRFIEFEANGQDFSGNEFPQAVPFTAAFGGSYQLNDAWSFGLDFSYTDEAFQNANNDDDFKSDDRFLTNLQVRYQPSETFTAGLFVRNLFDVDYRTQVFRSAQSGLELVRAGEPLTVGLFTEVSF